MRPQSCLGLGTVAKFEDASLWKERWSRNADCFKPLIVKQMQSAWSGRAQSNQYKSNKSEASEDTFDMVGGLQFF